MKISETTATFVLVRTDGVVNRPIRSKRNSLVKIRVLSAAAALLVFSNAHARENPYDALGKMLEPWISVFASDSKNPTRAVRGDLVLMTMTGMRPELAGASVTFAMESPDKLFLRAPVIGRQVAICRDGQTLSLIHISEPSCPMEKRCTGAVDSKS